MDKERCKQTVYPQERYGSFRGHQCSRKAKKDGYCMIHHPDKVKERQKKSDELWKQRMANTPLSKAQNKIKDLEADLKKAEDILKVMLNAKGNIKMLHSALVATEDYFKDR